MLNVKIFKISYLTSYCGMRISTKNSVFQLSPLHSTAMVINLPELFVSDSDRIVISLRGYHKPTNILTSI